ncbi:MAG TPA: ABC transporter permease, partial [Acidimicrobiales bacterium]|nr:ABC transporter permease [Acidimicrobiales bacterium]
MASYTARRLLSAVLVIFGVTLATFLLMHIEPGDPARSVLGIRASPSAVAALRREWGLNSSLPVQLGRFLGQLFQGNLGQSYIYHVSTASLIASRV